MTRAPLGVFGRRRVGPGFAISPTGELVYGKVPLCFSCTTSHTFSKVPSVVVTKCQKSIVRSTVEVNVGHHGWKESWISSSLRTVCSPNRKLNFLFWIPMSAPPSGRIPVTDYRRPASVLPPSLQLAVNPKDMWVLQQNSTLTRYSKVNRFHIVKRPAPCRVYLSLRANWKASSPVASEQRQNSVLRVCL